MRRQKCFLLTLASSCDYIKLPHNEEFSFSFFDTFRKFEKYQTNKRCTEYSNKQLELEMYVKQSRVTISTSILQKSSIGYFIFNLETGYLNIFS